MERRKRIGPVAHDAKKPELLDWVPLHRERLAAHELCATAPHVRPRPHPPHRVVAPVFRVWVHA